MSLETLFASPAALPTVPKVVHQLIQSFEREDISIDEIAHHLAADPVLSAKTLRLANSAYFHVSRHISNIDDALAMLGFVMVRNLVVGCGVAGAFKGLSGLNLPQFWQYCLHTAVAGRWLAQAAGQNTDLVFTVGLVHGLGQLLMRRVLPEDCKRLDRSCHPLAAERAAAEKAALGYHYGDAAAGLAELWKFPAEVSEALRAVPEPLRNQPPLPTAALVHVAAWRARIEALKFDDTQAQASVPAAVVRALRLPIVWLPGQATLGGEDLDDLPPMPALAELSNGLQSMFE